MPSLVSFVRDKVNPRDYWEWVFPDVRWPSSGAEARVISVLRDDDKDTPSLMLNPKTGAWYDHGNKQGGKSIVSFHAAYLNVDREDAALELYKAFVRPVIDQKLISKWHKSLSPIHRKYLQTERVLSDDIIDQFELGFDGERLTIPIRDEFGNWVNAKRYDPKAKLRGMPKMLNYKLQSEERSYGSPAMIYPIGALVHTPDSEPVIICEGELDALALISIGFTAVTSTHGSTSWPKHYTEMFRGRDVVIAYDNDRAGEDGTNTVLDNLRKVVKSAKRLHVPSDVGKDITDWLFHRPVMRKANAFSAALAKAELLLSNKAEYVEKGSAPVKVPLDQASRAEFFNRVIEVDGLVTGKDTSPFILPKKMRISCSGQCEGCPNVEAGKKFRELELKPDNPNILALVNCSKNTVSKTLVTMAGMPVKPACRHQIEVSEAFNVESLMVIPTLDDKSSQYVMRPAFYVGHGLKSNRSYTFKGTTTPDPTSQQATHLFTEAQPAQDEIDTFKLTPQMYDKVKAFQVPRMARVQDILAKLRMIADWQASNITNIVMRPDLHTVVDLTYHSVPTFTFNGEVVKRGMLDTLILGDTRCGKGYVAEGLLRYYKLGEIASGENCSFAGLVGGCESVGKRFIIKWGIIPLNHGRLVIIDEASSLSEEEFGHLSRVRSEGVAEISKIVREQTQANCRLIWMANPRSGRPISTYNAGVQAIKELVGANEDVSRFDIAMTVATNEVPASIINSQRPQGEDPNLYPADVCRALVLWAWSRKPNEIEFTPSAVKAVLEQSLIIGTKYSSHIPLVQAENIRVKVSKVAAALAARLFSTDDGVNLRIDSTHVIAASTIMQQLYDKPSMGYDKLSANVNERTTIKHEDKLDSLFTDLGELQMKAMNGLLHLHMVTADSLSDYLSGDMLASKSILSDLVVMGAITRNERTNWYLKNPAFAAWLRERKMRHESVVQRSK